MGAGATSRTRKAQVPKLQTTQAPTRGAEFSPQHLKESFASTRPRFEKLIRFHGNDRIAKDGDVSMLGH